MSRGPAWLLACRPATLGAAVVPVAVGTACAGAARPAAALAALFGAVFIQIGTNLANDVFDHEKGADTDERLGPTRAVQAGLLEAGAVRRGMVVAFTLATLCGVYLAFVAGPVVVAIGLASIAAGIAYTGGPWPLGYHGLGDVFVLGFFGFVAVCGTAFVQLGHVPPSAIAASIPVGALATAILVVNNVRDQATDARAGKRTLAVRFGRRAAVAEFALLVGLAHLVPLVWAVVAHRPALLLPVATLPVGLALVRQVAGRAGRELNATLVATAQLLVGHGLLLALAMAV